MPAAHAVSSRRLLALAALLLAFAVAAPASAISIAVDGGWTNFSWVGGTGPIDTPSDGYQFTSATSVVVQITDSAVIGDRFEIFVNSVSAGLTSAPVGSGPSGAFSGPNAWADSRLSKIQLALGPGTYDIDISVVTSVSTLTSGGFIQVLSVPEPGTLALLALGFAGLLWVLSLRQPSARPSAAKR
jgi:hypothetical protein